MIFKLGIEVCLYTGIGGEESVCFDIKFLVTKKSNFVKLFWPVPNVAGANCKSPKSEVAQSQVSTKVFFSLYLPAIYIYIAHEESCLLLKMRVGAISKFCF